MFPLRPVTRGTDSAKGRPIPVIKENFQAAFLGKVSRFGVEDDDARLCDRGASKEASKRV
jgi:hypothetical protein